MEFDRTRFGVPGSHALEVPSEEEPSGTFPLVCGTSVEVEVDAPTRLVCGQCGKAYYLGYEVMDERLFQACAHCIRSGRA